MHMMILRRLYWPQDREALLALDTSFTTGRVYRVIVEANAFRLEETTVSAPLHKVYDLTRDIEDFPNLDYVEIAEVDAQVVGVAALIHDEVDQRAIVRHLYVDHRYRGQGIGRALMDALVARARQYHVRCVWLETQDVNYEAIQFYLRAGFHWCGLDLSLDERHGRPSDETAIFFMRLLR